MKSNKSHKTINYVSKKNTYKKYTKSFIGGSGTIPPKPFFVLSESKQQQFFTDTFAKIGTKSMVSGDEFNKSSIIINAKDFPENIILYAFVILYYIVEHKFKIDINTEDKQKQTEFIKILKIFVDKIINDINTYNARSDDSLLRFQTILKLGMQKCILRYTEELTKIYKILAQYFSIYNSTIDINDYLFITCSIKVFRSRIIEKRIIENRIIESIEISPFAHIKPTKHSIIVSKHIRFNNTINVKGIPNKNNISNNIYRINFSTSTSTLTQKEYTDELKATKDKLTQIQNEINIMESKPTNKTNDDIMRLSMLQNLKTAHTEYLEDLQEELKENRVQTINYK